MNALPIDALRNYFDGQPIEKAWLFGSMARGEATQTSDVDIIVRFEKDSHVGLFKHISITDDLERILKRAVDLR
jgi:predicted nucleotidyltransferase